MIYWVMIVISLIYTGRLGWDTWRNGNKFGAVILWLLAIGIVIGSFWMNYERKSPI